MEEPNTNNYNYQGEKFLNRLFQDLHLSDEVMHTANKSDSKEEKIRKYLERLEKVEELAKNSRYNGIELLKEMYYQKYVIKPENIPESYFRNQKEMALERGYGHIEITEQEKEEMIDIIIKDQKKSLDHWLDYFLVNDAKYPEWFCYYAFQGMLKLGMYDKEKGEFSKRTESTTNIFVDLNYEGLALVYDSIIAVLNGKKIEDELLQKLVEGGSFSKLYTYALHKLDSERKYLSDSNEGVWIKYPQGSEPEELVESLRGRGTGWCTAGIETARTQLQNGDFYIYYTKDMNGEYKQPRIAIRMEEDSIAEIRGIAFKQNLESEMEEILDKKLEEFPDRDIYKQKVKDMEMLTSIYKEYKNRELTKEELRFLYQVDRKVKGFGYREDPRIQEVLKGRNIKRDLAKVFECSEEEISSNKRDVLDGKKIVCFFGDLDLNDLITDATIILYHPNIQLPKYVIGNLYIDYITNMHHLVLPISVKGSLSLKGVESLNDKIFSHM